MKLTKFLDRSIIAAISTLQMELQKCLSNRIQSEGHYLQALILLSLFFEKENSPLGPARMAKHFGYSRSRVSQEISKLAREGFVIRSLSTTNARNINLKLTSKGEKKSNEWIKVFSHLQNNFDKKLGERQAEDIASKLNEMTAYLKSLR